jgi:hypothetical protein
MARTHGTRSAYNAGCRCDLCREATRLARARQREAARPTRTPSAKDKGATVDGVFVALGLVLLIIGGSMWWRASHPPEGGAADTLDRARRRRMIGGCFAAAGVASVAIALREPSAE